MYSPGKLILSLFPLLLLFCCVDYYRGGRDLGKTECNLDKLFFYCKDPVLQGCCNTILNMIVLKMINNVSNIKITKINKDKHDT